MEPSSERPTASSSVLLASTSQQPQQHALPPNKLVVEARKKISTHLEDKILDYKHTHPSHVENCVSTLLKVFDNVLDNPGDTKFRQLKATSNAFKNNIASVKGGEEMFVLTGWRPVVIDLVKHWAFDGEPGSTKWAVLGEARDVLQRATATIHEKAERKRKEEEARKGKDKETREKILLAIEDDKVDRKIRQELAGPLTGPVMAEPLPSEQRRSAAAAEGHFGGPPGWEKSLRSDGGEEEEEEEGDDGEQERPSRSEKKEQ